MSYSTLITGLSSPRGIVLDSLGNIYVSYSNVVGKYNSSGIAINSSLITGLSNPQGIALDNLGNIYVVNNSNGTVGKYNSSGVAINSSLITGLSTPQGITLDSLGNIYVVNNGNGTVNNGTVGKYNSSGTAINASLISGLTNPYGIALDSLGNIYVAILNGSNTVGKYNSSGTVINSNFISGGSSSQPIDVYLDIQGNIYVAFHGLNTVGKYNSSGIAINTSLISGLSGLWNIALDSLGNIYVTNNDNGTVGKYTIPIPPCFLIGSKILTDKGYIPIEDLRKGDLVKTLKNDYLPIVLIGKSPIYNSGDLERIKNRLYILPKQLFPSLTEDLVLTGCHSLLVDGLYKEQIFEMGGPDGRLYKTDDKLRLFACFEPRAIPYQEEGTFTIYHLALESDNDEINYGIWANGLLVETCSKLGLRDFSGMEFIE